MFAIWQFGWKSSASAVLRHQNNLLGHGVYSILGTLSIELCTDAYAMLQVIDRVLCTVHALLYETLPLGQKTVLHDRRQAIHWIWKTNMCRYSPFLLRMASCVIVRMRRWARGTENHTGRRKYRGNRGKPAIMRTKFTVILRDLGQLLREYRGNLVSTFDSLPT